MNMKKTIIIKNIEKIKKKIKLLTHQILQFKFLIKLIFFNEIFIF
jgi:hypothetical protein